MKNIKKISIVLFIAIIYSMFFISCTEKNTEDIKNTETIESEEDNINIIETDIITVSEPAVSKFTYEGDFVNAFPNPERGYYKRSDITERTDFSYVNDLDITIVHSYIPIYKYLDLNKDNPWSDDISEKLPEILLENLQNGLDAIREAGSKVILRPAYAWDWTPPVSEHWGIVKSHIAQINEIISKNADVVMGLEAGILGPWGEWHSDGIYTDANSEKGSEFRYELIKHILDTTPDNIPVMLRYPYFIREILYRGEINPPEGQSKLLQSQMNRIGYHDDSFMADENDWGSYNPRKVWFGKRSGLSSNSITNKMFREWMMTNITNCDGFTMMMGGETEWDDKATLKHENSIPPLRVLTEMADMHTTYMNTDYNPKHINLWKNTDVAVSDIGEPAESVYDRINRRLGYRFRLIEAEFTTAERAGSEFMLQFTVINDGFANFVKERPIYIVLENGTYRYVSIAFDELQHWHSTHNSNFTFTLPEDMPKGIYTVALWMPDMAENLRNRPEYSVRFANKNMWDSKNGYNKIGELIIY